MTISNMTADQIREKYLSFFQARGHTVVASDSLVPKEDPTVLFTPAGMNQFKKQFLGMIAGFTRAASSQRCLRTDDLDKVGKTDCHHTFFEMLGNFSFGDYFKKEAIAWAWQFLTEELKIDPDRLWVSVYLDDDEAYAIWKDAVKVPQERIVRLGDHDNFWPADAKEKGPNGPCGPCSEIFFDLGAGAGCRKPDCSPACGCGRFIEIWNLVFTQFNRKEGGILEPLPQKNIDTGMGLERIAAVMQGKRSNFETDLFAPVIAEIRSAAKHYDESRLTTVYAVADHIRAIVFSVFDGIMPSNEARGYVVRKLIRKSVLHLRELGIKEPFLCRLVPVLAQAMKAPYPELAKAREHIAGIVLAEEKNFIATLESSDSLLQDKYRDFSKDSDPAAAGVIAFQLYDTYGIPLVLTMQWLAAHQIPVSQEAFEEQLNLQKTRSKSTSAMQGDVFSQTDTVLKDVPPTAFLGYTQKMTYARILKILRDDRAVESAGPGQEARIILDQTVFYPESGGQIGDTGIIENNNHVFEVTGTQKVNKVIVHIGASQQGTFKVGDMVMVRVYVERRLSIARNHTATHLLQAALRKVLGMHVRQQGSFVADDRLRFDFTHFKDVSDEELDRIEEIVNSYVLDNHEVVKKEMSLEQARSDGALAFFAEKYEDAVRVISINDISKELCGGTHLDWTSQIGLFQIVQESSVASGIRRIEAVTGTAAYKAVKADQHLLAQACELVRANRQKLIPELDKRLKEARQFEKKLNSQKEASLDSLLPQWLREAERVGSCAVVARWIPEADMQFLRKAADGLKAKAAEVALALATQQGGKVLLIAATNVERLDVLPITREIAVQIGGSGGGRRDFAQAGGTDLEAVDAALKRFVELVRSRLTN